MQHMPAPVGHEETDLLAIVDQRVDELKGFERIAGAYDAEFSNDYRELCIEWLDRLDLLEWNLSGIPGTSSSTAAIDEYNDRIKWQSLGSCRALSSG